MTSRELPKTRSTVQFYSGDLAELIDGRLREEFESIWVVGGGMLCGQCLKLRLADEVRLSILPIVIGDGVPFFDKLSSDIALHLAEVKAYKTGMVALLPGSRISRSPVNLALPLPDTNERTSVMRYVSGV